MAYVAIDWDGSEWIYSERPRESNYKWMPDPGTDCIELPKGSIRKLIGRELTWKDGPVELKDEE